MYLGLTYSTFLLSDEIRQEFVALLLFRLIRYATNNYPGNLKDKKSVMEYYFFIHRVVVFWCNKK